MPGVLPVKRGRKVMSKRCFSKITYKQYRKDTAFVEDNNILKEYTEICLPKRATGCSAGYDFFAPKNFTLNPGQEIKIPTGIRAFMNEDEWLGIFIRSGHGFKYNVRLNNSVAVIDADYVRAKNEGHIWIAIYNGGKRIFEIKKGEAFAQGVFQKYLLVDDDMPVNNERYGGLGSTSNEKVER